MTNSGTSEILIVEDNPANVQVLAGVLDREGYGISVCQSGERALEYLASHEVDLILLDVNMPGMDGFETCRKLRERPASRWVPVIFLTARTDPEDVVRGFQAGGMDYVGKPFQPEELLARVRTHLELRRAREEIVELRSLVPVCAWCRKVRSDKGAWQTVEEYIKDHSAASISHGICPDCKSKILKED
ncbi:MAG TPA: response regulator [Fibrobacteria bacterium]|nr:response regulator [Fibrobacteria bacterium]HOX51298.1 response regulator [Fibrobacteria bacterium]